MRRTHRGMTLLEILVVVGITSVLLGRGAQRGGAVRLTAPVHLDALDPEEELEHAEVPEVDPEARERLKALGYIE